MNRYYLMMGEETRGPYTEKQLQAMWLTGSLTLHNSVMIEGDSEWDTLSSYIDTLEMEAKHVPALPQVWQNGQSSREVEVTDVNMRFWSMVVFMIKWAFASIPAFIVLALVFFSIGMIFIIMAAALGVSLAK